MTTNQIAYQANLIKAKEAETKAREAAANIELKQAEALLAGQRRATEKEKTALTRLEALQEAETRGTSAERGFYSAGEAAHSFWNDWMPTGGLKSVFGSRR